MKILAALAMAVAVTPTMPVKSLQELIALARKRPGEIAYGTSGTGTSHHLIGEQFGLVTKAKFVHAPYQGGAPAAVGTVGGHSPMLLVNVAEIVDAGRIRDAAAYRCGALREDRTRSQGESRLIKHANRHCIRP